MSRDAEAVAFSAASSDSVSAIPCGLWKRLTQTVALASASAYLVLRPCDRKRNTIKQTYRLLVKYVRDEWISYFQLALFPSAAFFSHSIFFLAPSLGNGKKTERERIKTRKKQRNNLSALCPCIIHKQYTNRDSGTWRESKA